MNFYNFGDVIYGSQEIRHFHLNGLVQMHARACLFIKFFAASFRLPQEYLLC